MTVFADKGWIDVFIDFETFWGTKYSLRSPGMSYTDYICDEKFQVHGCSFIITDDPELDVEPVFQATWLKTRSPG